MPGFRFLVDCVFIEEGAAVAFWNCYWRRHSCPELLLQPPNKGVLLHMVVYLLALQATLLMFIKVLA